MVTKPLKPMPTGNTSRADDDTGPPATVDSATVRGRWSDSGTPARTVVDVVAVATNTPPENLVPLYEAVDPDALNRLLEHSSDGSPGPTVSFQYAGCDVTVRVNGTIVATPR